MPTHEHDEFLADELLLGHICAGCSDCFALLFHRYFRQVFATSFKILRDRSEAEDILQEVFLAIFLQQERFDNSRGSVKTWILQFSYFKSLLRRRYLRIRNFYKQEELTEAHQIPGQRSAELLGMSFAEWSRYVGSDTPWQPSCRAFGVPSNWRTVDEDASGFPAANGLTAQ